MHEAAYDETRACTTGKMQSRSFFHAKVLGQAALCKEVCRELDRAAETCANHSCAHAAVYALDTFAFVDLAQAIKRVLVVVLGTDREKRRVGLQACLH